MNVEIHQERERRIRRILTLLLIAGLAVLMIRWAFLAGTGEAGPDESMRYVLARYICSHGKIPTGFEPEVRDSLWGFSYAVYPCLSSVVSALYMRIAGIWGNDLLTMLTAGRMASVTFLIIAAVFAFLTGEKLFQGWKGFCFAVLILYLPGFHYLGTYINNDSLALMAVSIILYAWACALREGWRWGSCVILAVGIGICLLSYYNAYGWILISIPLYFFLAAAGGEYGEKKAVLKKAGVICIISLGISAWWFIRSYYLYDGDFLGLRISGIMQEQYAVPGLKPSAHLSAHEMGWSLKDLIMYRDPGWPYFWLKLSVVSFIGTFGFFNLYMKEAVSWIYIVLIGIPLMISLVTVRRFVPASGANNGRMSWNKDGIFNIAMLLAMCIPVILYVIYAYRSDIQGQGRYMMAAVFAVMYFVVCGFDSLLKLLHVHNTRIFYMLLSCLWVVGAWYNFFTVIVPVYAVS